MPGYVRKLGIVCADEHCFDYILGDAGGPIFQWIADRWEQVIDSGTA